MWPHQNCQGDESDLIMKTSTLSKSNQKWYLYKDEIYQFYIEKKHTLLITMNTFEQKYCGKVSGLFTLQPLPHPSTKLCHEQLC
jgi:hypothetical protein